MLVALSLLAGTATLAADEHGYSEKDFNACLDCHENSGILGISETKHADFDDPKSPAAQKQCQSCHGPSARHMKFPMQVANVHFGKGSKASASKQNMMCLECHTEGGRESWQMSPHGFEEVLCNNCHAIHQPDRIVPSRAAATASCNDSCHTDLMNGAENGSFTHRVKKDPSGEDDFACTTCHNPHGPLDSARCFECHEQSADEVAKQSVKAQRFHKTASEREIECVRCHKGLAHPIKPLDELKAQEAIEAAEALHR